MHCEAKRHHGAVRYQSIATLGVATESTGESFISLDTSWSNVERRSHSAISIEIPLPSRSRWLGIGVVLWFRTTCWHTDLFAHPAMQISQFATIRTKRHMGSSDLSRKGTAAGRAFR